MAGVASVSAVDISAASPVSIGPGLGLFQDPGTPLPGSVRDISLSAVYTAVHLVWGPHVISINWRRDKQSTSRQEDFR